MSTRCNVIIKDENTKVQLYHHHDGYPEGVGQNLTEYMEEIKKLPQNESSKILSTPLSLAKWLCDEDREDEYELEREVYLHGDIEYLYVIDLGEGTIVCYEVRIHENVSDEDYIDGNVENPNYEKFIYRVNLAELWNGEEEYGKTFEEKYAELQVKYNNLRGHYVELKDEYTELWSSLQSILSLVSDTDDSHKFFEAKDIEDIEEN